MKLAWKHFTLCNAKILSCKNLKYYKLYKNKLDSRKKKYLQVFHIILLINYALLQALLIAINM